MNKYIVMYGLTLLLFVFNTNSQAALHGRLEATPGAGDYQAYYDDDQDITWLADASAGKGTEWDDIGEVPGHDDNGYMTYWFGASPFAYNFSLIGESGWRVPGVSELEYMYHVYGVTSDTPDPFINIAPTWYWSRDESPRNDANYLFHFAFGGVGVDENDFESGYVWIVFNGDAFTDFDLDGILNGPDNCPDIFNPDQSDRDNDKTGDLCDPYPDNPEDPDNDGINDGADNCPRSFNPDQLNSDNDTRGNACDTDDDNDWSLDQFDNCPITYNPSQTDSDNDGIGDACDMDADTDNDSISDPIDNCPFDANPDQSDWNNDGVGDVCDNDLDNDGWKDRFDNCPSHHNPDQLDIDGDGIGDVCDSFPNDIDNDGIDSALDNCPDVTNPDQIDLDQDGIGDACDPVVNFVDLDIAATADKDIAKKGSKLTYSITVINTGNRPAENISFESRFGSDVRLINISTTQGSCDDFSPKDRVITCSLGSLDANGKITLSLQVKPMKLGELFNTMTVNTDSVETNVNNNSINVSTTVIK